jgi:hypothetical protein
VRRYVEMQKRVLKVQKHFMWHDGEPVRKAARLNRKIASLFAQGIIVGFFKQKK